MQKIGVIGSGAWGAALAQSVAGDDRAAIMWAREPEVVKSVNEEHENKAFLPGVKLHKNVTATDSLSRAAESDIILLVTPAQFVRPTMAALRSHLTPGKPVVICAKGIEIETGLLMTQVAKEEAPDATLAILTGPTFAIEIAKGLPSAVTIAAEDKDVAQEIRDALASRVLRPYVTDDLIGAQVGGAVKNVIAIASGVIDGRGLGDSARAAMMTRGLAEIARLSAAMGGKRETLMGLCGIGDLMLTASSMQSRNFSLGFALGQGRKIEDILGERRSVTEGVYTAKAMVTMAAKHAVDMPICLAVHKCVNEGADITEMIDSLLDRPLRANESI